MILPQKIKVQTKFKTNVDGQNTPEPGGEFVISARIASKTEKVKFENGEVQIAQAVLHTNPNQLYLTQGMVIEYENQFYTIIKTEVTIGLSGKPVMQYSILQLQNYENHRV